MLYVRHRVNTISGLKAVPSSQGVEIDLRASGKKIILQHEPGAKGPEFSEFLKHYRHAALILNVKCDGIEEAVLKELKKRGVKNYFFLDLSFPAIVRLFRKGERRIALRASEYESAAQCVSLKKMAKWVWLDCFSGRPAADRVYRTLKRHFRLCLVSPELQHYAPGRIEAFRRWADSKKIDAVCTKFPERWTKR